MGMSLLPRECAWQLLVKALFHKLGGPPDPSSMHLGDKIALYELGDTPQQQSVGTASGHGHICLLACLCHTSTARHLCLPQRVWDHAEVFH